MAEQGSGGRQTEVIGILRQKHDHEYDGSDARVGCRLTATCRLCLFGDRPEKTPEPPERSRGPSAPHELAITLAQPFFSRPCNVAYWFGQLLLPQQLLSGDTCGKL